MSFSPEYELAYLFTFKYINTIVLHPFHLSKTLMQINYCPIPLSPKLPQPTDLDTYLHEKQVEPELKPLKKDSDGYAYTPYHDAIFSTAHQQVKDHGLLSLYAGHVPFYLSSVVDALVRPLLESLVAESLGIDEFDASFAMTLVRLGCHMTTCLLTLPLDILNVRQMAQHPRQQSYLTTTHGLQQIKWQEVPFKTHFIYHLFTFGVHHTSLSISSLAFTPVRQPIRCALTEWLCQSMVMFVELPIEAVMKRQMAKAASPYPTRVPLSHPLTLTEGLEDLYEESEAHASTKWGTVWGMCRGWGMTMMVNGLMCMSHILISLDEKQEILE